MKARRPGRRGRRRGEHGGAAVPALLPGASGTGIKPYEPPRPFPMGVPRGPSVLSKLAATVGALFLVVRGRLSFRSRRVRERREIARLELSTELRRIWRGYDAAGTGPRGDTWDRAGAGSGQEEVRLAGPLLRRRSRELVRNDEYAAQALEKLTIGLVGKAGIWPKFKTPDKRLNKRLDALFRRWAKHCLAGSRLGWPGALSKAVKGFLESGESLVRFRPRLLTDELAVPLKLQLFEPDLLDATKLQTAGGREIVDGLELDAIGEVAGFWLLPTHPGDTGRVGGLVSKRVAAGKIAHLFDDRAVRPGQLRGIPWLTPAIVSTREFGDYMDSDLVRKKIAACLVAFIYGAGYSAADDLDGMDALAPDVVTDSNGDPIEQLEPGIIGRVPAGKEVKFNDPPSSGGVKEFADVQLLRMSAGYRMPYSRLTGDLRQANFASARLGDRDWWAMLDTVRDQVVIPLLCDRVADAFVAAALTADPTLPDFGGPIRESYPRDWHAPGHDEGDRSRETQTDVADRRAVLTSHTRILGRRGIVLEELLEEIAEEEALFEKYGIRPDLTSGGVAASTIDPDDPDDPDDAGDGAGDAEDDDQVADGDGSGAEAAEGA